MLCPLSLKSLSLQCPTAMLCSERSALRYWGGFGAVSLVVWGGWSCHSALTEAEGCPAAVTLPSTTGLAVGMVCGLSPAARPEPRSPKGAVSSCVIPVCCCWAGRGAACHGQDCSARAACLEEKASGRGARAQRCFASL